MRVIKKPDVPTKEGDTKEVKRFAIFPLRINETTLIWLEKYTEVFKAERILRAYPTGIGMYGIWLGVKHEWVIDWVSKEKKVI